MGEPILSVVFYVKHKNYGLVKHYFYLYFVNWKLLAFSHLVYT